MPRILAEQSLARWGAPHGGYHRTQQIHQIIAEAGMSIELPPPAPPASKLRCYAKGVKFLWEAGLAAGCNPRLVRRHGLVSARLAPTLAAHAGPKVLLWEMTHRNDQAVPALARRHGFSVVALPHNLEAYSRPWTSRSNGKYLKEELRALRLASAVFTISREEQWFLALQGIESHYLPYFPADAVARRLLEVRTRRRTAKPERFLILGTAGNAPTRDGMMALIGLLKSLPGGARLPVDIAGFGTESLTEFTRQTDYRVLGSVDDARLEELLTGARAVLAHQRSGVGALTRIMEMLVAGIPVIANSIAARSQVHLDGVQVYETAAGLFECLKSSPPEPALPARPVQAERQLAETLRRLMGRSATFNAECQVGKDSL